MYFTNCSNFQPEKRIWHTSLCPNLRRLVPKFIAILPKRLMKAPTIHSPINEMMWHHQGDTTCSRKKIRWLCLSEVSSQTLVHNAKHG